MTFSREAVTFSREAVKFFSKAVKFSRAAVTFFGRNSHQPRQNSFYDLSHHACKYIIVITVNEPSPLAPLTPALGAGGVGGVGCFLLVPIIIRARITYNKADTLSAHTAAGLNFVYICRHYCCNYLSHSGLQSDGKRWCDDTLTILLTSCGRDGKKYRRKRKLLRRKRKFSWRERTVGVVVTLLFVVTP